MMDKAPRPFQYSLCIEDVRPLLISSAGNGGRMNKCDDPHEHS